MCMLRDIFCPLYSLNITIGLLRKSKQACLFVSTANVNVETEEYKSDTNNLSPEVVSYLLFRHLRESRSYLKVGLPHTCIV